MYIGTAYYVGPMQIAKGNSRGSLVTGSGSIDRWIIIWSCGSRVTKYDPLSALVRVISEPASSQQKYAMTSDSQAD